MITKHFAPALLAATILATPAMAAGRLPEAEIIYPFATSAAMPCDNTLRTMTYVAQETLNIKKVFVWQGLSQHKASDVTMNIWSEARQQNFVIAGHDDYMDGADGGRQFREDFGGLYYVIPAGDTLTLTYSCSKNPNVAVLAHWLGLIVQFTVRKD